MASRETGLEDGSETTSQPVPFSVQGKTAIVTGAGSGINYSFAALLLSKGCNVLLADLTLRPEAQHLLSTYPPTTTSTSTTTPTALFHPTDVTSWPQLTTLFTTALTSFGTIDIVCPGAGIFDPHWSNFWHPPGSAGSKDSAEAGHYTSLDVNLTHPIRVTQMAISHFLAQGVSPANPKRVVLISSIAGQTSTLCTPLYVAAKHGINGFIRSLGDLDANLGIRVNGVAPGIIKTPLWTEHPEKLAFLDETRDEWASAEEVATAMVRCLEEGGLGGGTVLEVGRGQTRRVEEFGDRGPAGSGHTVSNVRRGYEEVYGWLGAEGWGKGEVKG